MSIQVNSKLIAIALQANVPALVWGSTGVAKSSIIQQILEKLGYHCETLIAAIRDPTDFGGLPIAGDNGEIRLHAHSWAQRLTTKALKGKIGCLNLEEINQATQSTQASLMRVVLDRWVGDTRLDPQTRMIASANPPKIAIGGWILGAPLANRFFHIENWTLESQYWANANLMSFPVPEIALLPKDWYENNIQYAKAQISAFITKAGHELEKVPNNEEAQGGPFPTPRSWTMAQTLLAAARSINAGDDIILPLISGCVGQGAAIAFVAYKNELNLLSPEEMLRDYAKIKWPVRGDLMYAMLANLQAYVLEHISNTKIWTDSWKVLSSAAKEKPDIAAAFARNIGLAKPKGTQVPPQVKDFLEVLKLVQGLDTAA